MSELAAKLKSVCKDMFSDQRRTAAKVRALSLPAVQSGKSPEARAIEIQAALNWIYECLISENGAGNEKRIEQSEDLAMRELQRPASSTIEMQLQAKARFILAIVAYSRCEIEVCASNVAQMAAVAPRWFRAEFPEVFERVIKQECQAAYDQLKAEIEKATAKSYTGQVVAKRAAAVAVGTGVAAAAAGVMVLTGLKGGLNYAAREAIEDTAKPIWTSATPENARKAELNRVTARFEKRLDDECRAVARKLI